MSAPKNFFDPVETPVRFSQRTPTAIFAFGESSFPVSFVFDGSPREAKFAGAVAFQLGTYLANKNIYTDSSVTATALGESQSFVLTATGSDVTSTSFYLTTTASDGSIITKPAYGLMEIRQPSFNAGVAHSFLTSPTARLFNPVMMHGDPFYPSAIMKLSVHRMLSSGNEDLATVMTLPTSSTNIILAPASSWGVVDVEIAVELLWYEDAARTIVAENPPLISTPTFGLRMYISNPSKFSERGITSGTACVVNAMYPTSVLRNLGGDSVILAYWGTGSDDQGLFWGKETGIEVSSNGLAIQNASETAAYVLSNELDDYDSSSSSSLSTSSLNSGSSASSTLNTSSISSSSTSTSMSFSSPSSASHSSRSSSSMSSSMINSSSLSESESSSSVSTALLVLSSSSSLLEGSGMTSSSSVIASKLAYYSFAQVDGGTGSSPEGTIADDSGNGHLLSLGKVSGSLGPPSWSLSYGVEGGGWLFVADANNTDYLQATSISWLTNAKSVSLWAKPSTAGNTTGVAFCVSNSFVSDSEKYEFAIQFDSKLEKVEAWVMVNGVKKWTVQTLSHYAFASSWNHVVVTHDGVRPRLYINGGLATGALTGTTADQRIWLPDLLIGENAANKMIVGSVPRYYAPGLVLGFSGQLDELTIWDEPLSASTVLEEFSKMTP